MDSYQDSSHAKLPKGFHTKDVVSTLSSDGVLTLKAPPAANPDENVRHIQIQQTEPARLNVSKNGPKQCENCQSEGQCKRSSRECCEKAK